MKPIRLSPEADTDLVEIREWYEQRQQGLGDAFARAMESIINDIQRSPKMYPPGYRGVR
jgi:plasmid stabilization system protein ParE